jgi:hypothetical protein
MAFVRNDKSRAVLFEPNFTRRRVRVVCVLDEFNQRHFRARHQAFAQLLEQAALGLKGN